MDMSFSNAYRILRKDIQMKPYNITVGPPLKDEHRARWKKFANRMKRKFQKEDTMRIIFSNEQMFDLDGIYSSQNGRIWAVSKEEANWRGGKNSKESLQKKEGYSQSYDQRTLYPLFCLKKTLSITIVSSRKYCLLLYDTETVNLETNGSSNTTLERRILIKKRKTGVPNIS